MGSATRTKYRAASRGVAATDEFAMAVGRSPLMNQENAVTSPCSRIFPMSIRNGNNQAGFASINAPATI